MILSKQNDILWNWYPLLIVKGPFSSTQVITLTDDQGTTVEPLSTSIYRVQYEIKKVGNYILHVDDFKSIIEIKSGYSNYTYQYKAQQNDPKTILLLDADQGIKDISMYNVPLTNNGYSTTPTYKKYGNNCFINETSTNYINILNFGVDTTQDWTVESWEYFPSSFVTGTPGGALFGMNVGSSTAGCLFCHGQMTSTSYNGNLYYLSTNNSSWDILSSLQGTDEQRDRWYHVAMIHQGNYYKFFCDGKIQWSTTNGSNVMNKTSYNNCKIGGFTTSGTGWLGCFDDLRISQCARYTDAFEVPKKKLTPYVEERLYRLE